MTVDKQVAGLLKKYLNYDYEGSITQDTFKNLVSDLRLFPLSVDKIVSLIEQQGYAVIYEPLLVYSKEEQHVRLSSGPKSLEQIIKKLNFCPLSYQELLNKCIELNYVSSGLMIPIETFHSKADIFILVLAKDLDKLSAVKNKYDRLRRK